MIHLQELEPSRENLEKIAALYIACFNAPEKGEDWTEDSAYQYFLDRKAENTIFAALEDSEGISAVCCGGDYALSFISKELDFKPENTAYISLLAIKDTLHGQGMGTKILDAFCELLKGRGFTSAIIRCRSDNIPMLKVLEKSGFSVIKEYRSELGGVTCERSVLLKALN